MWYFWISSITTLGINYSQYGFTRKMQGIAQIIYNQCYFIPHFTAHSSDWIPKQFKYSVINFFNFYCFHIKIQTGSDSRGGHTEETPDARSPCIPQRQLVIWFLVLLPFWMPQQYPALLYCAEHCTSIASWESCWSHPCTWPVATQRVDGKVRVGRYRA